MLLLKRKGVVLRNDCTDESVEAKSKGVVCLVDSVCNVVPSGFNGTRQQQLKVGELLRSGCPAMVPGTRVPVPGIGGGTGTSSGPSRLKYSYYTGIARSFRLRNH